MLYLLPSPSSPTTSLKRLRSRARRDGYRIAADRYTGTFTLIDIRLRLPLLGLDNVPLPAIAHALENLRNNSPAGHRDGARRLMRRSAR
jgi:hypothetical protein